MDARMDALDAQLRQILQAIQALRPCRCPPDMPQRLDAVEERLRALNVGGAALASVSAQGSVHPQGS